MKRILIMFAIILEVIPLFGKTSPFVIKFTMIEPVKADSWLYESDSINVTMNPAGGWDVKSSVQGGSLEFSLLNKSGHRIYIEWENARLNNERPIFDTDNTLTVGNKKEDESVPSGANSIKRILYTDIPNPISSLNLNFKVTRPWDYGKLKAQGTDTFTFLLPIRYENGKTKDISFRLVMTWINTADISLIKEGMKDKEVKKLIGTPEWKEKDKDNETEIWRYTNNASITLVKGVVTEINKL